MDIRFVRESIFDVESESLVYFTDNSLLQETDVLIQQAGDEILVPLIKLNGLMTTEARVIPAFHLKPLYVILACIPTNIATEENQKMLNQSIDHIFENMLKYHIASTAMDTRYITNKYGSNYINILNQNISNRRKNYNDLILYMCRGKIIDNL